MIKLRHHGDVLLTTPVFNALKEQLPQAESDILIYSETIDMIQYHPNVNQVHCIDRKWKKQGVWLLLKKETKLLQQLKSRRYDLILNLSDNWRGAWLCRLLKPSRSSAELYLQREKLLWKKSFTHPSPQISKNCIHTIERNLEPLKAIGLDIPAHINFDIGISKQAQEKIKALYISEKLLGKPIVHIHPGARWGFKRWENSKWVTVIKHLQKKQINIVLSAAPTPDETTDIEEILSQTGAINITNLCGKLTLQELGAAIAHSSLFLGVDSAPMHMAAALKVPAVVLFGPTKITEWTPWNNPIKVFHDGMQPDPDQIDTSSTFRMLSNITCDEVITEIQKHV